MKKWKIQLTPESTRLLSKLHPENRRQIKKAIIELRQNPYTGKDLQEELFGFKSLRIKISISEILIVCFLCLFAAKSSFKIRNY
jgi:hypothetical protein